MNQVKYDSAIIQLGNDLEVLKQRIERLEGSVQIIKNYLLEALK